MDPANRPPLVFAQRTQENDRILSLLSAILFRRVHRPGHKFQFTSAIRERFPSSLEAGKWKNLTRCRYQEDGTTAICPLPTIMVLFIKEVASQDARKGLIDDESNRVANRLRYLEELLSNRTSYSIGVVQLASTSHTVLSEDDNHRMKLATKDLVARTKFPGGPSGAKVIVVTSSCRLASLILDTCEDCQPTLKTTQKQSPNESLTHDRKDWRHMIGSVLTLYPKFPSIEPPRCPASHNIFRSIGALRHTVVVEEDLGDGKDSKLRMYYQALGPNDIAAVIPKLGKQSNREEDAVKLWTARFLLKYITAVAVVDSVRAHERSTEMTGLNDTTILATRNKTMISKL